MRATATGAGASVAVGCVGAIVGGGVLGEAGTSFGLWSGLVVRAALWAIGAVAAGIWWVHVIEARGMSLEEVARA